MLTILAQVLIVVIDAILVFLTVSDLTRKHYGLERCTHRPKQNIRRKHAADNSQIRVLLRIQVASSLTWKFLSTFRFLPLISLSQRIAPHIPDRNFSSGFSSCSNFCQSIKPLAVFGSSKLKSLLFIVFSAFNSSFRKPTSSSSKSQPESKRTARKFLLLVPVL